LGRSPGDVNPDPFKKRCMNPGSEVFQVLERTIGFETGKSREDHEIGWR